MRPLALTLEGVACYRDRQSVSFEGVQIFAVSGPTGAGKSTLLDAILFVLFGEVPRLGSVLRNEFISTGRTAASVSLEFSMGPRRYRCFRQLRRSGATLARLELLQERSTAVAEVLAEQVRTVNQAVVKLLGMNATTFMRAVMLPQGEFAAFLKAAPRERREILADLLGVSVVERMRQQAAKLLSGRQAEHLAVQEILQNEYGVVLSADLPSLDVQILEAEQNVDAREQAFLQSRAVVSELFALRMRSTVLEDEMGRLTDLEKQLETVTQQPAQVRDARLAAKALQIREEELSATALFEQESAALEDLRSRLQRLRFQHAEQLQQIGRTKEDYSIALQLERGAQDRERFRELRARHDTLVSERQELLDTQGGLRKRALTLREDLYSLRTEAMQFEEGIAALSAPADVAFSEEYAQALLALEPELEHLRACATERRRLRDDIDELEGRLVLVRQESERISAELKLAEQVVAKEILAVEGAEADKRRNALAELASGLVFGEPCPLCEQTLMALPSKTHSSQQLVLSVEEARARFFNADRKRSDVAVQRSRTQESMSMHNAQAVALREKLAKVHRDEEAIRLRIERAVLVFGDPASALEKQLSEMRTTQDATRERALGQQVLAERLEQRHREISSRETELAFLDEQIASYSLRLNTLELSRSQIEGEMETLRRRWSTGQEGREFSMLQLEDFEENDKQRLSLEILQSRIDTLSTDERENALRLERLADELSRKALVAATQRDLSRDLAQEAQRILADLDLQTWNDVALLAKSEEQLALLAAEEQRLGQQVFDARERVERARQAVGDAYVSDSNVRQAESESECARHEAERARANAAELRRIRADTAERQTRAQTLASRGDRLSEEIAILRRLASDLRSDRFTSFILRDSLRTLVAGASQHMKILSDGRYTLGLDGDEIRVIDMDLGQEARGVETLSGGETFLASLSFAIELSEQVMTERSQHVDCFFIDEGFGSLDSDALNLVTKVLHSLPQHGRLVGVITHVTELRDEFEMQLRVSKDSSGGSTLSANW